jgi:hypothetical protein
VLTFIFQTGSGQLNVNEKYNTIHLKKGQIIISESFTLKASNDTIVKVPVNEDYIISRTSMDSIFYENLKNKAYKRKWTKEIHNILLVSPKNMNDSTALTKTKNIESSFLEYNNYKIRNIDIQQINVFGATIENPDVAPKYLLGKVGNSVHINTRKNVIKRFVLFKKGDQIDPYLVAETERLLREQSYIEDVKINIIPVNESDSADIKIIVKDNWSTGINLSTSTNLNDINVNLWDNNIVGTGQTFENNYYYEPEKLPNSGIEGFYNINNIFGSFINTRIGYEAYGNQGYSFQAWRDFYTQETKYAGEFYYEEKNLEYTRIFYDTLKIWQYYPLKYRQINTWLGRAFPLGQNLLTTHSNISFSMGMYYRKFTDRPYVAENYRYDYQNRTFYLANISFSSIGHYKSKLVYSYGRTEDIPYGIILNYTHGIEYGEFDKRLYNSLSLVAGNNLGQVGFGYFSCAFGGFLNKNSIDQAVFKTSVNFFSNLLVISKYKNRHFINISYCNGYQRNYDEKLNINNFSGIRGYFNDTAIGSQKLVINYENVIFTPFNIADFRFALFGFVDLAWIDYKYSDLFKNPVFCGLGIGIRLYNQRLVFKNFQIRLSYYPNLRPTTIGDLFTLSDEWRFRPPDMNIKSPQIVEYK